MRTGTTTTTTTANISTNVLQQETRKND